MLLLPMRGMWMWICFCDPEYIPDVNDPDRYKLASFTVPKSCGNDGVPDSGGNSSGNVAVDVGIGVGVLAALGLVGFVVYRRKNGSGGGLATSLVANKRGTLF